MCLWEVSPLPVIRTKLTVTKAFNFYMFRPCLLLWLLRIYSPPESLVTESLDFLLVYKTHQVWLLSKLVVCVVPGPRVLFPLFTERVIFISVMSGLLSTHHISSVIKTVYNLNQKGYLLTFLPLIISSSFQAIQFPSQTSLQFSGLISPLSSSLLNTLGFWLESSFSSLPT